ncbi:MAG: sulfatase-like hydrolase/transferase [Prolixibacteraceae bacterium]|nr:sulfatase-like hydrolase/transferase [Prolixibacteraceae bacterium]
MNLKIFGIATLVLFVSLSGFSQGKQTRPNVLIIMTDQQRWDAIGCAGNLEIKTPNLDRLAKGGVQFLNAFSSCPVCVPARTSLLTGHTIFNVKVLGNKYINNDDIPHFPTFDQILSANGYRTEYYGKWHVPYQFASKYDNEVKVIRKPKGSNNDDLVNAPYKRGNTPFDLRFQNPEMVKQIKLVYYAMITQDDEWIGKMLNELDRKGLSKNTLVVFVSDHGEMLGDHGLYSKMKMYEGSVHVPLIMRFPGVIPAGTTVKTPVSQRDIFATILDYTGMKIPENDGRSLRSLIEGKKDSIDYAVSAWGAISNGGPFMIRKDDWKLIVYLQMNEKKQRNVSALYNLKSDPLEMNNLIGTNPEKGKYENILGELRNTLKNWMIKTHTPYIKELENTKL